MVNTKKRCSWANSDPLSLYYHDNEWGVPIHNDNKLFEFLTLEGTQAGLSWVTILKRRQNYKTAFDFYDTEKISNYKASKILSLQINEGIIRNKLKINSVVLNAKSVIKIQKEFGSFNSYIWKFVQYKSIKNKIKNPSDYITKSKESEAMSKDLIIRGFKFVGPTICYAYMQAVGMVNDHITSCFRYDEV